MEDKNSPPLGVSEAEWTGAYNGTVQVERQFYKRAKGKWELKDENVQTERMEVHVFATRPAVVKHAATGTFNIGNYETVRIHVGVDLPCYKEEVEEAMNTAESIVEARFTEQTNDIREMVAKSRKESA